MNVGHASGAVAGGRKLSDAVLAAGERVAQGAGTPGLARAVREIAAGEARALRLKERATSLEEAVMLRRQARALAGFGAVAEDVIGAWSEELGALARLLSSRLATQAPARDVVRVSVPAIALVRDPATLIKDIIERVLSWHADDGVVRPGSRLARQVSENLLAASGVSEEEARKRPQRLVWPEGSDGAQLVERYLWGTPLAEVLLSTVPWGLALSDLYEHMWVTARIGHGKTQGVEWLILQLLHLPAERVPSLVIIDSQGEMLGRIARLACFAPGRGKLSDRIVIVDPRELDAPVALNPFALRRDRLAGYSASDREQVMNGVVELLEYVFGAVLDAELTQKMQVAFRFVVKLLLSMPNSTLHTLLDVLEEPSRFEREIAALDEETRRFFDRHFLAKDFTATRMQVLRRVYGIIENQTFSRLLGSSENRLDLFDALQSGKIILVDTAKDFLKEERSAILGRLWKAMTLQAVFERSVVPREKRRPTFIIADEFQDIADATTDKFLIQARKFNAGVFLLHQHLGQLPTGLRRSLMSCAGVKLIGGVSDEDAREFARNVGTEPETLMAIERRKTTTEFALHVRNRTRSAIKIEVPLGALDREPTMSELEWERLLERNRERYGTRQLAAPATPAVPAAPPIPADEDDWRS